MQFILCYRLTLFVTTALFSLWHVEEGIAFMRRECCRMFYETLTDSNLLDFKFVWATLVTVYVFYFFKHEILLCIKSKVNLKVKEYLLPVHCVHVLTSIQCALSFPI